MCSARAALKSVKANYRSFYVLVAPVLGAEEARDAGQGLTSQSIPRGD